MVVMAAAVVATVAAAVCPEVTAAEMALTILSPESTPSPGFRGCSNGPAVLGYSLELCSRKGRCG